MIWETFMLPLNRQFDDGFQAVGDAFKESADKLLKDLETERVSFNTHLPANFLLRHSIELFLKSCILTIHRALKLSVKGGPHGPHPFIQVDGKIRSLYVTHSIAVLYAEVNRLIAENHAEYTARGCTKWETSAEMDRKIAIIDESDKFSDFFRYPTSKSEHDERKSSFIKMDPNEVLRQFHGEDAPVIDEVDFEVFGMQPAPISELSDALKFVAGVVYGVALALHMELVEGYGPKLRQMQMQLEIENGIEAAGGEQSK